MQSSFLTNIIRKIRSKTKNTRAQSAIEIGLVMPVILILILGSFDIAKICVTYLDLNATLSDNLGKMMTDDKPAAMSRALDKIDSDFAKKSFFKAQLDIERLGPYPPGSRNTIGTVWCVDGSAYVPITYSQVFKGRMAKISKRVCSLQEVSLIQ